MKTFLVGLIAVVSVLAFATGGSIWFADGIARSDGFAVVVGTVMLLAASGVIYVIGEGIEA